MIYCERRVPITKKRKAAISLIACSDFLNTLAEEILECCWQNGNACRLRRLRLVPFEYPLEQADLPTEIIDFTEELDTVS